MRKLAMSGVIVFIALGGVSCSGDGSAVSERVLAPAMPDGGGGPPKVEATDPTGAEQGTRLVVRVLGSNFDDGSEVTFKLDRKTVADVITNSTTFVSSSELEVDVSIGAEAVPDFYDVEVQTARGKKGIGVELFEVQQATFTMTMSGDLAGEDPDAWKSPGLDQIVGGFPALDVQGWVQNSANLQKCFPDPTIRSGAFSITRMANGEVTVGFNPQGMGTDDPPTTDIKYLVIMTGVISDGPFPPSLGNDVVIDLLDWQIDHDTGKGKKVACSKSGEFSQPTTIGIQLNPTG